MDYSTIQQQFNKVITYNRGIKDPQTNELFQDWAKNKERFINAMNGNLIYEHPEVVSFHLSLKEKENFFNDMIIHFIMHYGAEVTQPLCSFIESNGVEGFFTNTVTEEYTYEGHIIPRGMKLLKAFKYFIEDKNTVISLQNYASRIIQEDKLTGRLCLSVHPLDYLSLSENTYNWRSCHALDGDYAAGNLSYMADTATIICYLRGDHDNITLPAFGPDVPWNSKKWRMLLNFSENSFDFIMAGRQYPFVLSDGLDIISSLLIFPNKFGLTKTKISPWVNKTITEIPNLYDSQYVESVYDLDYEYYPIKHKLYTKQDLIQYDEDNKLFFCDLTESTCYTPYYTYSTIYRYSDNIDRFRINIGNKVKCLHCGNQIISQGDLFICNDCATKYGDIYHIDNENYVTCVRCGSHGWGDEEGHWLDDTWVCDYCYDRYVKQCPECGYDYFEEDLVYNEHINETTCIWCKDKYGMCREEE